mgnify:CR=1 FL=1|jgi:hypothetical protein
MAKDKLQKGIEGTTFKPQKKLLGVFGESKEFQKKMYDKTSALKRDAHRKGRVEGKKFRAKSFVDRKTGTLKLDTVSNRKRYGERVYKAPDVSYVEPIKYSKGGLKGNQKKLDKNNNNRIDSEDFKILRGQGKAPMKAKKGKLVPLKKDPTKAISSVKPSAGGKGSGTTNLGNPRKSGENFMERRLKLKGLRGAGRIGAAAAMLGLAGAGAAKVGQTIGRKIDEAKNKNKKMGGGMMRRYSKGGGMSASEKFKHEVKAIKETIDDKNTPMKADRMLSGLKAATKKAFPKKKMGGGMMKKPMGYTKGGGADTGKIGEMKSKLGVLSNKVKRTNERLKRIGRRPKLQAPERGPMTPLAKKMGGGMMMKPMGYKSGTSVKVKCKLGRNKPTKMY